MRRSTLTELFSGALLTALVASSIGATLRVEAVTRPLVLRSGGSGHDNSAARALAAALGGQCGGGAGGGGVADAGGSGGGCGDGKSLAAFWCAEGGAGSGAGDPLAEACQGCRAGDPADAGIGTTSVVP